MKAIARKEKTDHLKKRVFNAKTPANRTNTSQNNITYGFNETNAVTISSAMKP